METKNKKFGEYKLIKIGNIFLNTVVEDVIREEMEETQILLKQVKDINNFVEV
jgi:hypothetical protein